MKKLCMYITLLIATLSTTAQTTSAESYYFSAYHEISGMLAGRDSLSIKRSVFLAEWAYFEGNLNYKTDFCDEIDRIVKFLDLFYHSNNFRSYKTGRQMALNEYFFRPYSGNQYKPYTYDFKTFSMDDEPWERQFVSKLLRSHEGQCRSLPWMYKILANEFGAEASLAHAPGHCYIMYKDLDNFTPEDWINLELTTHQMHPAWWIKEDFEIHDSAVIVGTYMTSLTDVETIACQLTDLALGYHQKFNRYDEFTFHCASRSLEFYTMNPNAWIIRWKSLERMIQNHLIQTDFFIDNYAAHLINLMKNSKIQFDRTYMTTETDGIRERRKRQAEDAKKYTQEYLLKK